MHLVWLEVTDFRSYTSLRFEPAPGVNVLVGDNGSGKTSVLEAIGYLATLSSFRRSPDGALVREGAENAITRGEFSSTAGSAIVEVETPASGRRTVLLNGKRARTRSDVAELVTLVAFLPDDLDLIKRGPSYRREYLDDLAVQLWPTAGADQADYDRALRQRNALLRREGRHADTTTLEVLDERVARLGGAVTARRLAAAALAMPAASRLHAEVGEGTSGSIGFQYEAAGVGLLEGTPDASEVATLLADAIRSARQADLDRRTTTVGPHRDELIVLLGGRDARTRASQGEQRSIALGLRMAAYSVIVEQRDTVPILLLDDVFSELDAGRSERLAAHLPGGQVFVTSAREEEVPLVGSRWNVEAGEVTAA